MYPDRGTVSATNTRSVPRAAPRARARIALAGRLRCAEMSHTALVLTGGGARGAYQAGALRGIAEVLGEAAAPFDIYTGTSVGAINATFMASRSESFATGTAELARFWSSVQIEDVFDVRTSKVVGRGLSWIRTLMFGGLWPGAPANHLLDTQPLRRTLGELIDFDAVRAGVAAERLRAVGVVASHYGAGSAVTFFDGHPELKPWVRRGRLAHAEPLALDHVMASSAIPVLFPPVPIGGRSYGDGGLRLGSPVSPALRLGAHRVVAIGLRRARTGEETQRVHESTGPHESLADVLSEVLNSVFIEHLDSDTDRVRLVNRLLARAEPGAEAALGVRHVPLFVLQPSQDLGALAHDMLHTFPPLVRHLLRGWGTGGRHGDLLSYLAFSPEYTTRLVELGRNDALAHADEIREFFAEEA